MSKILSDARTQTAVETQLVENGVEILNATYETMGSSSDNLAHATDMVYNVRTEVREIQPLAEYV